MTHAMMNAGGINLANVNDCLDSFDMSGVTDTKYFTFVMKLRFDKDAYVTEHIIGSNQDAFRLFRRNTGSIQFVVEDDANNIIASFITSDAPCQSAGAYTIFGSLNIETEEFSIAINDEPQTVSGSVLDNVNVDWSNTDYSIGARYNENHGMTGDIYLLWLDTSIYRDFNLLSNRRKFIDNDGELIYLGDNGELPTGIIPELFLAYDGSDNGFIDNKGMVTGSFTKKGIIADVVVNNQIQYMPRKEIEPPTITINSTGEDIGTREISGLKPERKTGLNQMYLFTGYCRNASDTKYIKNPSAYHMDIGIVGIAGLDIGVPENNTGYFVYVCSNKTDGSFGAVFSKSISLTGVDLTYIGDEWTIERKLPFGIMYDINKGGFPAIHISNWNMPTIRYTYADTSADYRVLAGGTQTDWADFSLINLIPDNARVAEILVVTEGLSGSGKGYIRSKGNANSLGTPTDKVNFGEQDNSIIWQRVDSHMKLQYKCDAGVRMFVYVRAYEQTESS